MGKLSCIYLLGVIFSLVFGSNGYGLFRGFNGVETESDGKLECSKDPADIMFVLDSSRSIWPPHFKKQLQFVKDLVDQLDVGMGPTQTRVGVMSFSNWAQIEINLDDYEDREELKGMIDNIRQLKGDTNTGEALRLLRNQALKPQQGSRHWVRQIAILITDGKSQNKTTTQIEAQACKQSNIELFAIGIGYHVSDRELRGIASNPKRRHYIRTPDYNALDRVRKDVVKSTCQRVTPKPSTTIQTTLSTTPSTTTRSTTTMAPLTTEDPAFKDDCKDKVADVFFLMDSSSSIRIDEYKKQINVIEDIVRKFDIGPSKTRIGAAVFSHEYYSKLKFGDASTKEEILKVIGDMEYLGGGTNTGKALSETRFNEFNRESVRPGVDKILILFTDGQSADGEKSSEMAKLLKESGVKIFVVGIGPYIDAIELEDIASRPTRDFVHTFETFDELLRNSELISRKTCTVDKQIIVREKEVCNATRKTDLMFMVNHNHFGKTKTNRILKAAAEVVRRVGSNGAFRFGTLFEECRPKQGIHIGAITKERQLIHDIVSFQHGSLSSLIRQLRIGEFSPYPSVRKIGLLFLDNSIELDDPQIQIEIKRKKNVIKGIQFYVVVIGEGVDVGLVEKFIAPKERIIFIKSYDNIVSQLPFGFTDKLCAKGGHPFVPPLSI